jgi:hypothetical protein
MFIQSRKLLPVTVVRLTCASRMRGFRHKTLSFDGGGVNASDQQLCAPTF